MKQKFKGKLLAGLLSACMIFQTTGIGAVYATGATVDNGTPVATSSRCTHHSHDENCGYAEGMPCNHEKAEDCYVELEECVHEHTDECYPAPDEQASGVEEQATDGDANEPTECSHICDEASGCLTKELDCMHTHDETCGYTVGKPCTFDPSTCEVCKVSKEETPQDCTCETPCTEDEMNADCPVCGAEKADLTECSGEENAASKVQAMAADQTHSSWDQVDWDTLVMEDKITVDGVTYTYKGDSSTGIYLLKFTGNSTPLTGDLVWKAEDGYVLYRYSGTTENPGKATVTLHNATIKNNDEDGVALQLPYFQLDPTTSIPVNVTVHLEETNKLSGEFGLTHGVGNTTFTGNGTLELNGTFASIELSDQTLIQNGAKMIIQSGTLNSFEETLHITGTGSQLTIEKDAKMKADSSSTLLKIENGGNLENNGTFVLFRAIDLKIENKSAFENNGTIQFKTGTTLQQLAELNLTGTGSVQVKKEVGELFDTFIKVGETYYLSGGDVSTGLNLNDTTPTITTVYQAGTGTALWEPAKGKLTLTDATIAAKQAPDSYDGVTAVALPTDVPVTVVLKGKNDISSSGLLDNTGFGCGAATTFDLTEGSETTVTVSGNRAYVIQNTDKDVTTMGTGTLSLKAHGNVEGYGIRAENGSVNLNGGVLSIQIKSNLNVMISGNVQLGGVTIPAEETLDLTSDENKPTTVVYKGGTMVNGTLMLDEKPDFTKLSGNGIIKVGSDTYTTDGDKLIVSTTALDFSKTAEEGNWKEDATLEADGYKWEGDETEGYTLTLKNLYLTVKNEKLPAITLPKSDCKLVLQGTNILKHIEKSRYAICANGSITISGDGKLMAHNQIITIDSLNIQGGEVIANEGIATSDGNLEIFSGTITAISKTQAALNIAKDVTISGGTVTATSTNRNGLNLGGNLTISGGTVTVSGRDEAAQERCGVSAAGNITISGGSVTAKGAKTAIWGKTGITLTGMRITKPAGAVIGDSVNIGRGKAILLNGADALNVTIEKYTAPSGGGGDSSGGDGGLITIVTPDPSKPTAPTTTVTEVKPTVDKNGNATVSITDKTIDNAIKKAQDEAKKNGTEANGIAVEINATSKEKVNNLTVALPKSVQEKLIGAKVKNVTIKSGAVDISFDLEALKQIKATENNDVTVTVTKVDNSKLSSPARDAVGNRPVFDFKVTGTNGKRVTNFKKGSVSIAIPYTLAKGEKAGNIVAAYINNAGQVEYLTSSSYNTNTGKLFFTTNHFSAYGVAYKADATATTFSDVANHWAKESIEFVAARGLLAGTGEGKFSPNGSMTRGMFVTALGRLAGADVSGYKTSSFRDVKEDAYYTGYVEWASKNGIVNGVGEGRFAPDQSITREQMAVIMQNYAKTMGFTLPKVHTETTFADNAKISSYAKDAVKAMQVAGVLIGKDGNQFDPQGTATRAEVSAMLKRFVELM